MRLFRVSCSGEGARVTRRPSPQSRNCLAILLSGGDRAFSLFKPTPTSAQQQKEHRAHPDQLLSPACALCHLRHEEEVTFVLAVLVGTKPRLGETGAVVNRRGCSPVPCHAVRHGSRLVQTGLSCPRPAARFVPPSTQQLLVTTRPHREQ